MKKEKLRAKYHTNLFKKTWFKVILLSSVLLLALSGCGKDNTLSFSLDHAKVEAQSTGNAKIKGKVAGKGKLYINRKVSKNQPNKKGRFTINYTLPNKYQQKTLKLSYRDEKDKENKIVKKVIIQPNQKKYKKHKEKQESKAESKRIEENKADSESESREKEASESIESEMRESEASESEAASQSIEAESSSESAEPETQGIEEEMDNIVHLAGGYITTITPLGSDYSAVRIYIDQNIKYLDDSQKQKIMDSFGGAVQRTIDKYKNHYGSIYFYYDGGADEKMGQSKVFDRQQFKLK